MPKIIAELTYELAAELAPKNLRYLRQALCEAAGPALSGTDYDGHEVAIRPSVVDVTFICASAGHPLSDIAGQTWITSNDDLQLTVIAYDWPSRLENLDDRLMAICEAAEAYFAESHPPMSVMVSATFLGQVRKSWVSTRRR